MKTYSKQSGAALLMAMVFLAILAIIGISSMKNTRIEQKMSTNIQELNHAFQYAESGLAAGLSGSAAINTFENNQGETTAADYNTTTAKLCTTPTLNPLCSAGSNEGNAAIVNKYLGQGNGTPVGYSQHEGFVSHFFVIGSKGTVNSSVTDTHEMGFSLVGPSDNQD